MPAIDQTECHTEAWRTPLSAQFRPSVRLRLAASDSPAHVLSTRRCSPKVEDPLPALFVRNAAPERRGSLGPSSFLGIDRQTLDGAGSPTAATRIAVERCLERPDGSRPSAETVARVVDLIRSDPALRQALDRALASV